MARNVKTSTSIALWVCLTSSIGLFIASFIVPPMGAIDPSVLKAGGEILGIATLFMVREAIMEGLGVKMTHGNTSIEIKDLDGGNGTETTETEDNDGEDNGEIL
jgi:hypothetical protein